MSTYLKHYGKKGMKWGVRNELRRNAKAYRFQAKGEAHKEYAAHLRTAKIPVVKQYLGLEARSHEKRGDKLIKKAAKLRTKPMREISKQQARATYASVAGKGNVDLAYKTTMRARNIKRLVQVSALAIGTYQVVANRRANSRPTNALLRGMADQDAYLKKAMKEGKSYVMDPSGNVSRFKKSVW